MQTFLYFLVNKPAQFTLPTYIIMLMQVTVCYILYACNHKYLYARAYVLIYVTLFWKTDHVVTFSISRNTDFKYSMGCSSPMVQYSHARPTTLSSLVIYT